MSELDERLMDAEELGLPTRAFAKQDGGEDMEVYGSARFVFHIDDTAIAALTSLYAELLPFGGPVLDLMSSWVSHLPVGLSLDGVVGHGMNTKELESNHDLDQFLVQDLNRVAALPERYGWFDAVLVCAGVQYLQRPLAVFCKARRVLGPDGVLVVSFSNRCFPTKAVSIWRGLDKADQARLVSLHAEIRLQRH